MKFSIVATALFAQGIAAMPWSSVKGSKADGEEITVRIRVSGGSSPGLTSKPFKGINTFPVCLKVCWPEEHKCPEGWDASKLGDDDYPCWTCCRKERDEDL